MAESALILRAPGDHEHGGRLLDPLRQFNGGGLVAGQRWAAASHHVVGLGAEVAQHGQGERHQIPKVRMARHENATEPTYLRPRYSLRRDTMTRGLGRVERGEAEPTQAWNQAMEEIQALSR